MKTLLSTLSALLCISGPAAAAPRSLAFYSKLDLPLYSFEKQPLASGRTAPLYIGSDKSYAAESKEVQVIGRSLSIGLAVAGLLQPLGPLAAVGFLIVGAVNARSLASTLASKPSRRSSCTFLWTKSR